MIEKKTREELMAIYPCSEDCMVPELVAEIERLRAERDNYKLGFESRTEMLNETSAKLSKLSAKLAWFEERDKFVDDVWATVTTWYIGKSLIDRWEHEHPKPE